MYFPYIRGRLYDLLALQIILQKIELNDNLIPIIEPVRLTSTLINTMRTYTKRNHKLCIICNPEVGTFKEELESDDPKNQKNSEIFFDLLKSQLLIKTCIIQDNCQPDIEKYEKIYNMKRKDWYVINRNKHNYQTYLELFTSQQPKLAFIPDGSFFRRKIQIDKILLENKFTKHKNNSDYLKTDDEFFSEDHCFYKFEGYKGFGDYSIIGNSYSDSGFAPYAVAIHMVYQKDDGTLWIHHFVSDSNSDIKNPAKKFHEANTKLNDWINSGKIKQTIASEEFSRIYKDGSYPGLGTVKKLSIMHHIEIMNNILNGER
ncbi:MAG: sce7725 family protein [Sphaerochaeta sp.]